MQTNYAYSMTHDRRSKPRSEDTVYRFMVALNVGAWLSLTASLILFHLARPEMATGVQQFWGVDTRAVWSQQYVDMLVMLLQGCLGLSLVSVILRAMRSRRRTDELGVNLFILIGIAGISLLTLYSTIL